MGSACPEPGRKGAGAPPIAISGSGKRQSCSAFPVPLWSIFILNHNILIVGLAKENGAKGLILVVNRDGAYDSKTESAINHSKMTRYRATLKGIIQKKTVLPSPRVIGVCRMKKQALCYKAIPYR